MSSDLPICYRIGDVLAAKYRRAWYEAEIITVRKRILGKVIWDGQWNPHIMDFTQFLPERIENGRLCRATFDVEGVIFGCRILWIKDRSIYTVRFTDGRETRVRRNKLSEPTRNTQDVLAGDLFFTEETDEEIDLDWPDLELQLGMVPNH